ncbi:MAG: hypothetical protein ABIP50_01055 [Candidatus Saccharimonadales bacterium]
MSIMLTSLWVISLTLSLTGYIHYSPWAMVASIGVLGIVVFVTSVVFGRLLGVRVHTESSYITAFILFFIFTPTLDVGSLGVLALVGCIAAASKFILVYKGRHIFNPAAAGAFIISLTGLGFASWWVGAAVLSPFTFIIGFLVIQKTRRFLTSGVFLGLSIPLIYLVQLSNGSSETDAAVLLLSLPLFYFSGFMLTEPQTLPSKPWQKIFEVIVVVIVFAVPIHTGLFNSNPAMALVIGNLIAFGFTRRRAIILKYKGSKKLTSASRELTFTPTHRVEFEPGQYIEINLPHKGKDARGERRSFSITSSETDRDITLGVKFYTPPSSFKNALKDLAVGKVITATRVSGDFILPADPIQPLLFVAGGIGITPFISMLRTMNKLHETRNIVLVYSVSTLEDLAYWNVIKSSGIKVFVVCNTTEKLDIKNGKLIKEAHVTLESLQKNIPDIESRRAYISGPPFMIDSVKHTLKKLDVKHIKTDYFIGY